MSIKNDNIILSSTKYLEYKKYWQDVLEHYNNENYFRTYKEFNGKITNILCKGFEINSIIAKKLICNSKNNDLSLFAILLTTLNVLMYKYSDNKRLVTSIPCKKKNNNRNSFLPIIQCLDNEMSLRDGVIVLSNTLKEVYMNREYPLEEFSIDSRYPAVTFQLKEVDIFQCEDMIYSHINFKFSRTHNGLSCEISYNSDIFNEELVNHIFNYYCNILEKFVNCNIEKIGNIDVLSESDKSLQLKDFNSSQITLEDKSVIDYLEENLKNNPTKIVIDDGNTQISFQELFEKSNQWINLFFMKGINKGDRIAILLERSVEYVIAIVSVLRIGATYVPLDDGMPTERINYIIDNSEVKLLLLSKEINKLSIKNKEICVYKDEYFNHTKQVDKNILPEVKGLDIAYIIYTSGTTGLPKGVMINHKSIVNLILGFKKKIYCNLDKRVCFGFASSFCFDASIQGIFGALILGFKLFIISKEVRVNTIELMKTIREKKINVIEGTPMDLKLMLYSEENRLNPLELLLIGGEPLSKNVILEFSKKFKDNYKIYNLYGPTETAVDATYLYIDTSKLHDYDEIIPIGAPFPNKKIYILGKQQELLPIGSVGEIYISGEGIMNGYVNKELNLKCLFKDSIHPENKMYKTGDFGYWKTDGIIGYVGRKDNQVKIDGYRIELDEIEALLNKNKNIKEAVVLVENNDNDRLLSCYFVANKDISISNIIDYLKAFVPLYMIPKKIVQLQEIPYNINGKVDRKKVINMKHIGEHKKVVSPRDDMEKEILNQLKKLLKVNRIGIEDNFFELGGNSLKALQFINVLKNIGIEITLIDIFTNQTVKQLYDMLKQKKYSFINDFRQAETELYKVFNFKFYYVTKTIKGKDYLILKYSNSDIDLYKLNQYIEDNFDVSLVPNYIVSLEEYIIFEKEILYSSSSSLESYCNDIYNSIIEKWRNYEESVRNNPIEKSYSISMQQKMMLDFEIDNSGTNIIIDIPLNLKKFHNAFRQLVKKHPLLRSALTLKDNKYICNQFFDEYNMYEIPFIDLSLESIDNQEIIIKNLLNLLYFDKVKVFEHLLYKAVLIKNNYKEYILSIPAHHCIFDAMSGEVIKKSLLELYYDKSDNTILSYSDYSESIYKEMLKLNHSFIKERFSLYLFKDFFNNKIVNKSLYTSQRFEINLQGIKETEWEFALKVFRSLLSVLFIEEKIPVYIMSYGRHYKFKDYFNYFGVFIDLIPCIFNITNEVTEIVNKVNTNISFTNDNNINFITAIFNNNNMIKDSIGNLKLYNYPMIVFNFQGKTDENMYKLRGNLDGAVSKKHVTNKSNISFNGIYVETVYTDNKMRFTIESTVDIENFKQKVEKIKGVVSQQ